MTGMILANIMRTRFRVVRDLSGENLCASPYEILPTVVIPLDAVDYDDLAAHTADEVVTYVKAASVIDPSGWLIVDRDVSTVVRGQRSDNRAADELVDFIIDDVGGDAASLVGDVVYVGVTETDESDAGDVPPTYPVTFAVSFNEVTAQ